MTDKELVSNCCGKPVENTAERGFMCTACGKPCTLADKPAYDRAREIISREADDIFFNARAFPNNTQVDLVDWGNKVADNILSAIPVGSLTLAEVLRIPELDKIFEAYKAGRLAVVSEN